MMAMGMVAVLVALGGSLDLFGRGGAAALAARAMRIGGHGGIGIRVRVRVLVGGVVEITQEVSAKLKSLKSRRAGSVLDEIFVQRSEAICCGCFCRNWEYFREVASASRTVHVPIPNRVFPRILSLPGSLRVRTLKNQ